jgi:hypothetical protein
MTVIEKLRTWRRWTLRLSLQAWVAYRNALMAILNATGLALTAASSLIGPGWLFWAGMAVLQLGALLAWGTYRRACGERGLHPLRPGRLPRA